MTGIHAWGLVIHCDSQGLIQQVLRNDMNLVDAVPGRLFIHMVDSASRSKAMNFLLEIKSKGAVEDWELNIPTDQGIANLHFAGG
jgi:hypothetical protein